MPRAFNGHGPKIYQVGMTGKEMWELLRVLETRAKAEENFDELKVAVVLHARIDEQLREQRFYRDIEPDEDRVFVYPQAFAVK